MKQFTFDITPASNALQCPNPDFWYDKAYLDAIDPRYFNVLPGVKNSTKLAFTRFPSVLQAQDCTFAATSNPLSATTVTVCPLKANVSLCKKTLETSFVVNEMKAGSNNYTVNAFMEHYWNTLQKEIAQEIAVIMWQGNTAGTGATFTGDNAYKTLCNGFNVLFSASSEVVKITSSAVTSANVVSIMTQVLQAAPTAVKQKNGLSSAVFYVATNVAIAYRIALGYIIPQTIGLDGSLTEKFLGAYEIVEMPGMPDNEIVFTRPENLVYAFDGTEDASELIAVDQLRTIGVPNILTVALLSIGFQILNPSEIVVFN